MNATSRTLVSAALAASLGLLASAAWAQEDMPQHQPTTDNMQHEGMQHEGMQHEGMRKMGKHGMEGMHAMPATVTSVDKKTGQVEVTSEGMSLRVHFPPSSLEDLHNGDKITLHMGFSKTK